MTTAVEQVSTIDAVRAAVDGHRGTGRRIGLVPTMGALHEGHLSLVRLAAERADAVVVSVFVNPTQFEHVDDLAAYPRDLDADLAALADLGDAAPAVVFAPSVADLYPRGLVTTVHVGELTDPLEGVSRPGHFDAVATIVTKLLHIVAPDVAVFGRKDFQQLEVIRRLVADLDVPVDIVAGPTVREPDGVALSSRNQRLSPEERVAASGLSRALRAAVEAARADRAAGRPLRPTALREAAAATLAGTEGVAVDYVAAVDPHTFAEAGAAAWEGTVLVAVAAQVGPVRLIDNVEVGDLDDEQRLLDATAVDGR